MKIRMVQLCDVCLGPLSGKFNDRCELCDAQRIGNHVLRVARGSRRHLSAVLTDMKRHALIDDRTIRELTARLDYA